MSCFCETPGPPGLGSPLPYTTKGGATVPPPPSWRNRRLGHRLGSGLSWGRSRPIWVITSRVPPSPSLASFPSSFPLPLANLANTSLNRCIFLVNLGQLCRQCFCGENFTFLRSEKWIIGGIRTPPLEQGWMCDRCGVAGYAEPADPPLFFQSPRQPFFLPGCQYWYRNVR